ncbi:phosphoenolpyruvate carboxykinase (GTP) [Nocardioides renjunii]|uniref:phosphoenolpyruvate carboxykinase (GTP) n=1 Tax=Nocardioides renjunii TaxID=3095075 RepID=UPI002AFE5F3F|nr:phosphoenolpyruvate carboxykinase (GTP) [Nocardioides sp. S-34]WQQ22591.1 phosphoenolpyruvate carboxykinase (GTP) [Nocardioides sp. S-34]
MADLEAVMDEAGLTNPQVREFVKEYAELTGAERIEVVNASDDARLLEEAVAAGELQRAGEGRYYSRSYHKDTARSEERTIVATNDEKDRGVYNNWRPASEMKPMLHERMRGASQGRTMYVIPYLMAPAGNALEPWAAGVELTDTRTVVLHMIRMARVGVRYVNDLEDQGSFVRAVHVTGDLEHLGQGTPDDQRYFVTVADERTILHFGSSYGGNALLGKIAHGLRQGAYDGWASRKFLAEQYMLIGIHDKETGKTYHVCGGFPSASGKTNLAMMAAPDALGDRYHVSFYGDDIAWLWVDEETGRLMGMNPEYGVFGVAKDTNETTNPNALHSIDEGSQAIFTNVAYNPSTGEVWWEGKTPKPPSNVRGWLDWTGSPLADRKSNDTAAWAHPNSRFTTTLDNVPNIAPDYDEPAGVPIDAIIFGGRTSDREPLIRAITDLAEGVYDGLTLGAEATFAAEGVDGQLRYDPMSNRPFMAYGEGDYARHYLDIVGAAKEQPIFAHVNWFQKDPDDGHFLWPGYRDNLRPLLWLLQLKNGEVEGRRTAVGIIPTEEELDLSGMDVPDRDLERILTIDKERWQQEMGFREEHLAQFDRMPEEIWEAHRRVAADLEGEA